MADDGQFVKNADIVARAGANVSATAIATAATDVYVQDIEAVVNATTRTNWTAIDTASTINASVRGAIVEAGANLCAINVIQWDMSGIGQREAEKRCDILFDRANKIMKELKEDETKQFIKNP